MVHFRFGPFTLNRTDPIAPGWWEVRNSRAADGSIDHVLDFSRPNAGAIAALVEITGDPKRVVTISNHDEARSQGTV